MKKSNEFCKLRFTEDKNGNVHIYTEFPNEDMDGFFLTSNQVKGMFILLEKFKETVFKSSLESGK